jgi:hypothetical protein
MACDTYMDKARRKLQECRSKHDKCKEDSAASLLPSRVIDVGLKGGHPRLYTAQAGERCDYTVLSYSWGGAQPLTTMHNVAAMTERLLPVAQSVQDAIEVTRKLGIQYLWVDAICIIQDDPADRTRELRTMAQTYTNATLCICASNSESSSAGFATAQPPDGCELPFRLPDGYFTSVTVVPCNMQPPYSFPIDDRAWTFQERHLSKRILFFGHGELKWQCQSSGPEHSGHLEHMELPKKPGNKNDPDDADDINDWVTDTPEDSYDSDDSDDAQDSSSSAEPEPLTPHVFDKDDFHIPYSVRELFSVPRTDHLWHDIIDEYTNRQHAVPQDRVHAIAGMIEQLEIAWSDTCIAGLWRSRLVQSLFWISGDYYARDEAVEETRSWKRSNLYLAPSWSWQSVPGAISYHLHSSSGGPDDGIFYPTAQIIECSVDLVAETLRLGEMKGGKIVLRTTVLHSPGKSSTVTVDMDEAGAYEFVTDHQTSSVQRLNANTNARIRSIWGKNRANVLLAKLGTANDYKKILEITKKDRDISLESLYTIGLVLVPAENGFYKRIGAFQPRVTMGKPGTDVLPWEKAEEKTITII